MNPFTFIFGKVNYYYKNKLIHSSDILTVNEVKKAEYNPSFKQRFIYFLKIFLKNYI